METLTLDAPQQEAIHSHNNLVDTIHKIYPDARILITTVLHTVDSSFLHYKIKRFNSSIIQKYANIPQLTAIDCSDLSLKDKIDLSYLSKSKLAHRAVNAMLYI